MVRPTSVIWDFNGTIMDDAELAATSVSKLLQKRNPLLTTAIFIWRNMWKSLAISKFKFWPTGTEM